MQTLTVETTVVRSEKKTLNLPVPSFWKEPTTAYESYRAVLDEKTYVNVLILWGGEIMDIEHSTVERRSENIAQAQDKWTVISEDEFMEAYNKTWDSFRFIPQLKK